MRIGLTDRSPPPIVSAPQDLVYLGIKMLLSAQFLEEVTEWWIWRGGKLMILLWGTPSRKYYYQSPQCLSIWPHIVFGFLWIERSKICESVLTLNFACQSMREFGLWNRESREGGVGVQLQFEYIFTLLCYCRILLRLLSCCYEGGLRWSSREGHPAF